MSIQVGPALSHRAEQQLEKLLANYKLTPMTLARALNPRIISTPFLNLISARVATTIAKGNGRLIISAPPRHGKSELITKNTPIWTLENYGRKNVILCSYGGELSTDFGRKVRDLIQENEDKLNIRIREDASRVNNWLTNLGGAMYSVGLGGPITGRGADVLLIDDYIKEIKESLSQAHRDYIWDWFVTTAFSRLEPGGTCIIIATRWHEDDLIGRILKNNPGGKWEHIVVPALAEVPGYIAEDPSTWELKDILGRLQGEALFPQRFDREALLEKKEILGTYFFNALYQQNPEDPNAKLTDRNWLKYIDVVPYTPTMKWARIWDLAATEDGGDWMVGTLMAHDPMRDWTAIVDIKRAQLSPGGVEELLFKTAAEDGKGVTIGIEQEPGSSGKLLVHSYAEKKELRGYKVIPIPTSKNKVVRAQPFLSAVEAGKVYLVRGIWNKTFADEYDEFPAGDHDDQIDTAGGGYTLLSGKVLNRASWGREDSSPSGGGGNSKALDGQIILPNGQKFVADPIAFNTASVGRKVGIIWGR